MQLVLHAAEGLGQPGPVEVVERKGVGHPDTICDQLAERFSAALSRFYLERFGRILHHNVDKALLFGGRSEPRLGGGRVTAPMEIYLSGRATSRHGGIDVPVVEIARAEVEGWLRDHLRFVDPVRDVRLHCLVRGGASELVGLYDGAVPLANDTSFGVGYAPLSALEQTALHVERALNSAETKARHPALGEDVKVMAVRTDGRVELTVAVAMVDRFLRSPDDYRAACEAAAQVATAASGADVRVNAADDIDAGRMYLTVTGTSAEAGDDGQVGRGNRVNGLITPGRPMSLEAAAGKNPASHVGKLYNLLARELAARLVREVEPIRACSVLLVSRIGQPVSDPHVCEVRIDADVPASALAAEVEAIVRDGLASVDRLTKGVVDGRIAVC
ncbi:MAG: methionine adenosyltransferase [Alphaproteobacteria bacterium]|nr:methionine adenosyltransferase [Alphaproteobacteria bacterium]